MKVQLYVVDTHRWDYVTNFIDTKTMKENLFLAKMTLKMHFCSSIHFLLKPIFVLSTIQDIILLDQRQYIFMHYIVFLSASINGFGDYYYYELYICESERIP